MMKQRRYGALICATAMSLFAVFAAAPALAQFQQPPEPLGASAILNAKTLAVSTSSANTALPTPINGVLVVTLINDGSNEAFYVLGGSGVVATSASIPIPAGACWTVNAQPGANFTTIAAITSTGATNLRILQTTGGLNANCAGGAGGGGGGGGTVNGNLSNAAALNNSSSNLGTLSNLFGQNPAGTAWSPIGFTNNGGLNFLNVQTDPTLIAAAQAGSSLFGSAYAASGLAISTKGAAGVSNPEIGCDSSVIYDASTNGETQLVAASGSTIIYVCGYHIFGAGTVNVDLDSFAASAHTKITPAFQLTSQTGALDSSPIYRGLKTGAGAALYINTSAGQPVQALVYYTQF